MLILGLVAAALAEAPLPVLLYREPLSAALAQAEREAAPGEVLPRRLADLVQGEVPYLVGARVLSPCTGPAQHNGDVLRLIGEAEELRVALRPAQTWERLEAGLAAWNCLGEPADASVGARLHFLVGISLAARGEEEAARAAFRAALRSDPALQWDSDFAPDARPLFEAVRAEPSPPSWALQVVPAGAPVALRVDGRTLALADGRADVAAGLHLIQLQDGTALWAELTGDVWLILPAAVAEGALLDRLDDEASARSGVEGLARGSGVARLYVPASRATWELQVDSGWTRHRQSLAERLDAPLLIGGGSLLLAGGAWMLLEQRHAATLAASLGERTSSADYAALGEDYTASRQRWLLATGLTGVGGAVAGAGALFWVEGRW